MSYFNLVYSSTPYFRTRRSKNNWKSAQRVNYDEQRFEKRYREVNIKIDGQYRRSVKSSSRNAHLIFYSCHHRPEPRSRGSSCLPASNPHPAVIPFGTDVSFCAITLARCDMWRADAPQPPSMLRHVYDESALFTGYTRLSQIRKNCS